MENKKYSILIVGLGCYFGHIREFIVNLKKKNPNVNITLLTLFIYDNQRKEISDYVSQIVSVKDVQGIVKFRSVFFLKNSILYYFSFLKLCFKKNFDIVNIHFAKSYIKFFIPVLNKITKNVVFSPWGSDVMRVEDDKSIKEFRNIYSYAKYVTVSKDSQIGECIISKFKVNPNKFVKLGWGGEFFDYIKDYNNKVTLDEAKTRFGLEGRYVITCGYNMMKQQRHEEIINAINNIKDILPHNLTLLFPFTYDRTHDKVLYKETIVKKCKSLKLNAIVVEDHLNLSDLYKLRMATDIFIHVQTTDAGSRCVMEYVYCNKKVVHGSWIKYKYLENYKPSCYFPVNKMEDLGTVIAKAYHSEIDELPQEVKTIIEERGWNHKMGLWNSFFESIVS